MQAVGFARDALRRLRHARRAKHPARILGLNRPLLTTRRTGRPRRSPRPPAAGRRGADRADWHTLRLRPEHRLGWVRRPARRGRAQAGLQGPPASARVPGTLPPGRGAGSRRARLPIDIKKLRSAPRWGGERLPGRCAAHLDGGLNLLLLGGGEHHHAPGGASLQWRGSEEAAQGPGTRRNSPPGTPRCGWWRKSGLAGPTHLAAQGLGGPGRDGGAHGDGLHGCGTDCGCGAFVDAQW